MMPTAGIDNATDRQQNKMHASNKDANQNQKCIDQPSNMVPLTIIMDYDYKIGYLQSNYANKILSIKILSN